MTLSSCGDTAGMERLDTQVLQSACVPFASQSRLANSLLLLY